MVCLDKTFPKIRIPHPVSKAGFALPFGIYQAWDGRAVLHVNNISNFANSNPEFSSELCCFGTEKK